MPTGIYIRSKSHLKILAQNLKSLRGKITACLICGKSFQQITFWQKYCSNKCYLQTQYKKRVKNPCVQCGRKITAKNRSCRNCYISERKLQSEANLEHRFFSKVKKTKSCWLWTGSSQKTGHGLMTWHKERSAPRISWMIHRGKIPKGLLVLHDCDNPPCVNPNHLHLGNHSMNLKEAYERGLR